MLPQDAILPVILLFYAYFHVSYCSFVVQCNLIYGIVIVNKKTKRRLNLIVCVWLFVFLLLPFFVFYAGLI